MAKHILLTGGTGLIGKPLTDLLSKKGYQVSHLSRSPGKRQDIKTYLWNVEKSIIDKDCIKGVDIIVHLAGAGIAEKRWTDKRKKELIDSRVKSVELLYSVLANNQHQVTSFISASATGYYSDRGDELLTEDSPPAHDFLGTCCIEWEKAVDKCEQLGLRLLKYRTGVVLTTEGGALPQLAIPVKLGVGSPIGNGKQWIPWIHIQDAVDMYLYAIENESLTGVYNMVAPNPVTNKQLTKAVARQLHKPLWAPNVPAFVLKLLLGEMSSVVLGSTRVSAEKIIHENFRFRYPVIEDALIDIYG